MGVVYQCAPVQVPIYPVLTVTPLLPSIPNTTPLGTAVATISVVLSNGGAFTGTLAFAPPNFNDGGIYSLTGSGGSWSVLINPVGPGVGPLAGSLTRINVVPIF